MSSSSIEDERTSNFTFVPLGPLIKLTTSSIRQSLTSCISSVSLGATPTILSATFIKPDFSAGPPGINLTISVIPSFIVKIAPIPSKDRYILISKSS